MDVKKQILIKSDTRNSDKENAHKFKKIQGEVMSEKKQLPLKNRFQYEQEREKLANEFRVNAKKNQKFNFQQAPVLGREKEHVWNQPVDSELSELPFEDELMPVMSSNETSEGLPKFGPAPTYGSYPKPSKSQNTNTATNTSQVQSENTDINKFVVVINETIVFSCAEESELKDYVEQLLLENEELSTDDIIVMKRLKLSTGIILE